MNATAPSSALPPLLAAETSASLVNAVHLADCLELCERVYRAGVRVDMILADLPYGTTACSWDTVIPFEPMWKAFKRIIKPRGAIVLTASQPFTSALVMSNPGMFRYDVIWHKTQATGHLNAQVAPMREHEHVLIFSEGGCAYYPELTKKDPANIRPILPRKNTAVYGAFDNNAPRLIPSDMTFPRSVIRYANSQDGQHPTQKPVPLFRYLIRTYTLPNELVFDPTCGSGTTAVAAREEGRRYIVGDSSPEYVGVANRRLDAPYTPSFMPALEAVG